MERNPHKYRLTLKTAIGVSPGQYMLRRRMDEASRLLRATPLRISESSASLGSETPYEFSNPFKRQFGVFPIRFRHGIEGQSSASEAEHAAGVVL